jgi:MFS family permease
VGNLVGSVFADRLVKRFGSAQTLVGTALTSGVAYLIMASATSWHLATPAAVLLCLAVGAGTVVASSLRQRLTPPDVMGRVGAAWRGVTWGIAPAGALLAGVLAAIASLRLPIALAGILQIAIALVLARPLFRSIKEGLDAAPSPEGRAVGEGEPRRANDDGSPGPAGLGPVS